jgi:uncharacterized protein YihD (DUF1040 family)
MRTEYQKAYRQANKEILASKKKAYNNANKEAIAERKKEYRKANKEAIAERRKAHYQANKEVKAEQMRAYRQTHSHIINALNAKRRASKVQATPSWANKEHIDSIYLLASINRKAGHDVQVDHIVPLRSALVCGLHCESNLQLLQGSDNMTKGNRHWPDQW